jgi:hypothetical protein
MALPPVGAYTRPVVPAKPGKSSVPCQGPRWPWNWRGRGRSSSLSAKQKRKPSRAPGRCPYCHERETALAVGAGQTTGFLGSDALVESMRRRILKERDLREVPQDKPRRAAHIFSIRTGHADRDHAVSAAYASGGHSMREIQRLFRPAPVPRRQDTPPRTRRRRDRRQDLPGTRAARLVCTRPPHSGCSRMDGDKAAALTSIPIQSEATVGADRGLRACGASRALSGREHDQGWRDGADLLGLEPALARRVIRGSIDTRPRQSNPALPPL